MNQPTDNNTASALLAAARQLFASHGYDGTSVRAITKLAQANLGAITYHFGSKEALYEAALASVAEPFRDHLAQAAASPGTPLDRIARVVAAFFEYLYEHPELPRLMVQQLAGSVPVPAVVRSVLQANHRLLAELIAEGQRDGTIRAGDPRLMALSIGSQPILLSLVRPILQQAVAIDQQDPTTRGRVVESVVQFVRAGLAAERERTS